MTRDQWRDSEGFGREQEVEPRTWAVVGPDGEEHAPGCMFIQKRGVLPCSCDRTRREFTQWWKQWLRWQTVRSVPCTCPRPIKWPVHGPDGEWWIPGHDFHEQEN